MRDIIVGYENLYTVVTLQEAAVMWAFDRMSIMHYIWRDKIRARKSKGVWLLDYHDCVVLWGEPYNRFCDLE
jgi:hypothetical protein